ncbi:MAG: hypothetical protein QOG31_1610 [Thermoplasmata archaeon]|jgi:hypothetical protein|nr:hypothetical protein [Thermoplasmata archaeon]
MHNPMAALTRCGVLEQSRGRGACTLRVSPRFLAHAEATAARLFQQGRFMGVAHTLETALTAWDGSPPDVRHVAHFLAQFLDEREQMGGLRPVFPALEQFSAAA